MRLLYLAILFLFLIFNILIYINAGDFVDLDFIHIFPSILLIVIYISFKITKNTTDWTAIDNIFVVMFYVFHFSYLYLYYLGFVDYDSEVFWDGRVIYQSIYLLTIVVSSFLIGFNLIVKNTTTVYSLNFDYNYLRLYSISKFLLFCVLLFFWLPIFSIFSIAFSDYNSLISIGRLSPIGKLYWIGQYLAVGTLAIYYVSRVKLNKPFIKGFSSYFALFYILGYLAIGDRGGFIYFAVIPLIIYNLFYKKLNLLKGMLLGVVVLSISSVLAVSRVKSIYNPIEAINNYSQSADNNIVINALAEFGLTFKTIPLILSYIPERFNYWYGKSYIDAVLIAFPSFFGTRESSSISAWLTETAFGTDTYGRGGSILMESYGNFGVYGSVFFFMLLGLISGGLYNKFKFSSNIYWIIAYISFVASICLWMRNTSSVVFRTVSWSIILIWMAIQVSPYLPSKKK